MPEVKLKNVGILRAFPQTLHASVLQEPLASGKGKDAPDAPFVRAEKTQTRIDRPPAKMEPPVWLKALIQQKATDEVILAELEKRVRRAPSQRAFLEAQAILNDMGRRPKGRALLKRKIDHKLVGEFIALSKEA